MGMVPRGKSYSMQVKEMRVQEQERLKALDRKIDEMWENSKRPMNIRNYLYWGIYVTIVSLLMYFVASNLIVLLQFMRDVL